MRIPQMLRAILALAIRTIVAPFNRLRHYWSMKLKWWGKLRMAKGEQQPAKRYRQT